MAVNVPIQVVLGAIYCSLVYVLTDQPLEVRRALMFFTVCLMIALISEAIGMAISSTLNIVVSDRLVAWASKRKSLSAVFVENICCAWELA